jgi:lipopolysaccharide export LptBFGC system permease protein LptF
VRGWIRYDPKVKKLSRYIFFETLRPSLLGLLFYTFVLIMNQLFEVVRQSFQRGAGFSIVVQLLLLALPKILVLTIPMSLLLGVLVGLGRLSADSEVVALRAAGVSYWRMARPVIFLGFVGFLVAAFDYHVVNPWTNQQVWNVRMSMLRKTDPNREIRAGVFYDEIPDTLVYAEQVDRGDHVWPLRRIIVATSRVDASISADIAGPQSTPEESSSDQDTASPPDRTVVCGERGRIELSPDAGKITFIIEKGEIHIEDPRNPTGYQRIRQREFTTALTIGGSESSPDTRKFQADSVSTPQLLEEIRVTTSLTDWRKSPARLMRWRQAMIELNWRFSLPFAAIAFCFLGFPLGLINHRGGKASGFALSLIVVIFYWIAIKQGREMAMDGKLPLVLAVWGANLLVMLAGLTLLLVRQKRDVFSLSSGSRALGARAADAHCLRPHAQANAQGARDGSRSGRVHDHSRDPHPPRGRRSVHRAAVPRVSSCSSCCRLPPSTKIVELQGLMDALSEEHKPFSLALEYLAYFTPGMLKIVTPIACLVAAMITLGTMARANEDTALKAAGVSIFRISAPLLIATVGLSLATSSCRTTSRPTPTARPRSSTMRSKDASARRRWREHAGSWGRTRGCNAYGDYNTTTRTLQGVSAIQLAHDPFRIRRRVQAPRVTWTDKGWSAASGWEREFKAQEEPYRPLENTRLPWPETPDDFRAPGAIAGFVGKARGGDELLRPLEPRPQDGEQRLRHHATLGVALREARVPGGSPGHGADRAALRVPVRSARLALRTGHRAGARDRLLVAVRCLERARRAVAAPPVPRGLEPEPSLRPRRRLPVPLHALLSPGAVPPSSRFPPAGRARGSPPPSLRT